MVVGMRARVLILVLSLAGCAPPIVLPDGDLARVTAGRSAGPAQSCVAMRTDQNLRPVDSMTLAYGSGATIYVNQLGAPCPGLEDLSTIIVDAQSGQYCRGDRIRPLAPGAIIPGPTCNLGDWVPYRAR